MSESRSILRRVALMKGEPMPEFAATTPANPTDQIAAVVATPAVALDGQQYDWRDAHDRVQTRIGYDEDEIVDALARWYIHTDRLEAERDALLAEHEAWDWNGGKTSREWFEHLTAAHDNAERVLHQD
ncbi:MAG: hypothetical protein RBR38_15040 [Desulfomicrobium apsheronum]|nr:hypothetical protein [Desulfomicrobium apsheronum]